MNFNMKKILSYVVPTVIVIAILAYLSSGVFKEPDAASDIDKIQKEAERTTTTSELPATGSGDAPAANTKDVQVLGLGDLEDNFDKFYGKPKITGTGSEYQFVGGTIVVTFAPDAFEKNRAWQLLIKQKPTSKTKADELVVKFLPKDKVEVAASASEDPGKANLEGAQKNYRSKTLADVFPEDIFMKSDGKPDPGFFRVIYDIDDSNLVFQIRIVGGFIDI